MKTKLLALTICIMICTCVHAQQTIIVQRPGIFTDLASAAGAIIALPFAVTEGVVVGTAEAAGSLIHGSTQIVITPPAKPVPGLSVCVPAPGPSAPVVVPHAPAAIPTTTIITTHSDGTVTTVTRQASAYELGPVIIAPVDPNHRVGASPHVNPYVYRPR